MTPLRTRILALAPLGAVALLLLGSVGCGYALVGRASNLPEEVRKVHVEPLENRTSQSQVDQLLTRAITDELVTRRRFTVVRTGAEADAQLSGSVISFQTIPTTFDDRGRATEYEMSIVADIRFVRTNEEATVLWSNDRYLFKESYAVEVSQAAFFDRQNQAIEEVAERFAETMVIDLLEGF